jgi:lipid A 3-O-deacylase
MEELLMEQQTGSNRHIPAWAALIALTLGSSLSHAHPSPDAPSDATQPMTPYLRLDNDVFAGTDRGYSNGTEFGFVSATVTGFEDPSLPAATRWLNRRLTWLQPQGYQYNNVVITLGQGMYTPSDWRLETPDPNDRPYAGVLVMGVTYNGRDETSMRSTTLNIGMVGPSALAHETQDLVHDVAGGRKFAGWDHQLRDEPVFRLMHQRLHKKALEPSWLSDVIFHYGGSIGNLTTFVNAGAELRFGGWTPDNFGSAPSLPVGENTAPVIGSLYSDVPRMHGFVAVDVRYVVHDITLDGNTFKHSASVEREDVIADLGIGVAVHWGNWKIAFARYFRTREFRGQNDEAELGSLTIRRVI